MDEGSYSLEEDSPEVTKKGKISSENGLSHQLNGTPSSLSKFNATESDYEKEYEMEMSMEDLDMENSDEERDGEEDRDGRDGDDDNAPDKKHSITEKKRRTSTRTAGNRLNYANFQSSEDEDENSNSDSIADLIPITTEKVLEKILAVRQKESKLPNFQPASPSANDSYADLEFLIKWKGMSYLHTEWVDVSVLLKAHMGRSRLQKFFKNNPLSGRIEEPYPSSYAIVDRIIATKEYNGQTYYLTKFENGQYFESTWELAADLNDNEKIKQFLHREVPHTTPCGPIMNEKRPPFVEETCLLKETPSFKEGLNLRPYQLEGVNWLLYSWYHRTNSILADEMGLGKTVQTIAILDHLNRKYNIRGPFLIVVPLSTLTHWQREIERWTDMNAIVYHGNAESRRIIRQYEFHFWDKTHYDVSGPLKFNILITTYEMLITDSKIFQPIEWQYCVIDEAHRLKNKTSRLTTEFSRMKYAHLTLLTGTPVQNNMEELWTLLHILDPKKFSNYDDFESDFGVLKDVSQVARLQELLKPYLLRRMKEDVEKSIIPKEETIIEVELTRLQKKYYRSILEGSVGHLTKTPRSSHLPCLMNVMMQLRKCCNHPFLLKGVEIFETKGLKKKEEIDNLLIESSGKLVLIDKLIPKLMADNHKILIFSQMVGILNILEDYLKIRNMKYERIDGSIRGSDRQAAIDRFSNESSVVHIFLICTRAGGLGINLTAADTVIIFDSDWNPQNDLQAQARCHRIGQEKKVQIYRLITRNTYEKRMFERASMKLGLDFAVLTQLDSGDNSEVPKLDFTKNSHSKSFTSEEVALVLKNGAYDIFHDDDDASNKFCEENIDQILQARTQTVVHDYSSGSSTFSKASFVAESAQPELDVNDPDFWYKLMPDKAKEGFSEELSDSDMELSDVEAGSDDENPQNKRRSLWISSLRNRFQKGLMLFGFGRWSKIIRTARLRFTEQEVSRYAMMYLQKLVSILKYDIDDVLPEIMITETETNPTPEASANPENQSQANDPTLNEASFISKLQKNGKVIFLRLQLMKTLSDLIKSQFSGTDDVWGKLNTDVPEGWTSREDKDLLIGIYNHGFSKFNSIKNDPSLCFRNRFEKDKKSKKLEKGSASSEWPSPKWLTLRCKHVIHTYAIVSDKKQKSYHQKFKKDKPIPIPLSQYVDVSKNKQKSKLEWLKREMSDFYRVVTTWGIPICKEKNDLDFDFIKQKAKLNNKDSDSIRQYYYDFISSCKQAKEKRKVDDPLLTNVKARRALERITMFHQLRTKVLPSAESELQVYWKPLTSNYIIRDSELPTWWVPVKHDYALVKGIVKHGFGKWSAIFSDTSSEFNQIFKEKTGGKIANEEKTENEEKTNEARSEESEFSESDDEEEGTKKRTKSQKKEISKNSTGKPGRRGGNRRDTVISSLMNMPKDKIFFQRLNLLIQLVTDKGVIQHQQPKIIPEKKVEPLQQQQPIRHQLEIDDHEDGDGKPEESTHETLKRKKSFSKEPTVYKKRKNTNFKRDSAGNLVFPLEIGLLSVDCLGRVSDKKTFHNEKYIWPIGFKSRREYISSVDVSKRTQYICEILDGDRPIFKVTDPDDPVNTVTATSSSSAWKQILDRINSKRPDEQKRTSVSGPDYFGFGIPQIAELIAQLPGAQNCTRYIGGNSRKRMLKSKKVVEPINLSVKKQVVEDTNFPTIPLPPPPLLTSSLIGESFYKTTSIPPPNIVPPPLTGSKFMAYRTQNKPRNPETIPVVPPEHPVVYPSILPTFQQVNVQQTPFLHQTFFQQQLPYKPVYLPFNQLNNPPKDTQKPEEPLTTININKT
uniref:Uncharacterized protein n=1 Tax=Arcella intermedia TaxID=1963864 RepID=A0A6B2KW73_9EUKA